MSLKQLMLDDVDAVFLDQNEFASMHNIDGRSISCIIDTHLVRERDGGQKNQFDGLYLDEMILYVKSENLVKSPVRGSIMRVDGKVYLVSKVSEQTGLLEITIEANSD